MPERIFYATHNVTLGGSSLKGVQSVSLSSNFGIEPVFQLGQCDVVEYVPNVPECEVTITRALYGGSALSLELSNTACSTAEELLNEEKDIIIGSDAGGFTVQNALLSGYTVNFSTDGVFTEELTYVGDTLVSGGSFSPNNDSDIHMPRRQDWTGPSGAISARLTLNLGRDPVFVLGQYKPLKRFVQFPIETTLELGYLLPDGGSSPADPPNCAADPAGNQTFAIGACGTSFSIGKAKLSNIGYSGGDTGGGNVTVTYTYTSYNNVSIG
jgi:hypothetical protein